ncbi:hypothetical protein JL722_1379 [Aureococcus anophagefferens]|nr:hypothetical protein JL722_1379 [Aureococcus anophagefferens]
MDVALGRTPPVEHRKSYAPPPHLKAPPELPTEVATSAELLPDLAETRLPAEVEGGDVLAATTELHPPKRDSQPSLAETSRPSVLTYDTDVDESATAATPFDLASNSSTTSPHPSPPRAAPKKKFLAAEPSVAEDALSPKETVQSLDAGATVGPQATVYTDLPAPSLDEPSAQSAARCPRPPRRRQDMSHAPTWDLGERSEATEPTASEPTASEPTRDYSSMPSTAVAERDAAADYLQHESQTAATRLIPRTRARTPGWRRTGSTRPTV